MEQIIETLTQTFNNNPQQFIAIGIGAGVLIAFFALVSAFGSRDRASDRLTAASDAQGSNLGARRAAAGRPGGFAGIVPTDKDEYTKAARKLHAAGYRGTNAVRNYFIIRTVFGLLIPATVLAVSLLATNMPALAPVVAMAPDMNQMQILLVVVVMIVIGFYGPAFVVGKQAEERQLKITEGFPNALDLLQISVEAGLGFDAAMNRVSNELWSTNPDLSEEFGIAQQEIAAGKDRQRALLDMANRTGVSEVTAFVNVMLQSMEFGTSVSDTLAVYSQDMRTRRELKAIEKANKLPVKMSATLVVFMLPSVFILVLSPIVINWLRLNPLGGN